MINRNLILYSCRQAKVAYGDLSPDKVPLHDGQSRSRGFVLPGKNAAIVAFAGTESILDWLTDFMVARVRWYDFEVHNGFYGEFKKVVSQVEDILKKYPRGSDILITGHSMGAALASMMSYYMAREYQLGSTCITFESPRWTNWKGAQSFNDYVPNSIRIQHHDDLVCRVPKLGYWHVNRLIRINDQGKIVRFSGLLGMMEHLVEIAQEDLNLSVLNDHPIGNVLPAVELFAERGGEV